MKKIYWILIILVIAILLGTGFFLYEWNRPNKSTSELETAYALSAESLTKELSADPANTKYNGQVIEVTGKIDEIETDQAGNVSVIFITDAAEVQCTFDGNEKENVSGLQKGQSIHVKGQFTGYIPGDDLGGIMMPGQAKLNNCILIKE